LVRTRVAHLTSVHAPDDVRIFHKECKALAMAGYDVVLIAPHERDEEVDGISIRMVPKPIGRVRRMMWTVWQVYRAALRENAQIYHFHDPELIPIGILLRLHGKQVIYDVHEDLPRQILSKYWIPTSLRAQVAKGAALCERVGACLFDWIIAATPTIARRFPGAYTVTVQNFPLPYEFAGSQARPYAERPPEIAYVGGISAIRGLQEMMQVMSLLPATLNARLVLAGKFDPVQLETQLRQTPGWKHVEFVGWLSRVETVRLLTRVRLGLLLLHPVPEFFESLPTKLFEYMAAGLPILASDFPLWREMIVEAGCGMLVDPLDTKAIAEAIQWILEHPHEAEEMGQKGRKIVFQKYNWQTEDRKLKHIYRACTH
jgi:glycosyltransferase involved in cell wall biosynthesis